MMIHRWTAGVLPALLALLSADWAYAEAVVRGRAQFPSYGAAPMALSRETLSNGLDLQLWLTSTLGRAAPRGEAAQLEPAVDALAAAALRETALMVGAGPVRVEERQKELIIRPAGWSLAEPEIRVSKRPEDWTNLDVSARSWGERLGEAQRTDFQSGGLHATAEVLARLFDESAGPLYPLFDAAPLAQVAGDPQVEAWRLHAAGEHAAARRMQASLLNRLRLLARPSLRRHIVEEPLPYGKSSGRILKSPDGGRAVWKATEWQEAQAYRLSEQTGYRRVPAATEGAFADKRGTFRHFVEGARVTDRTESLDAWAFAYLAGNGDVVNPENIMLHDAILERDGSPLEILIDHHIAFAEQVGEALRVVIPFPYEPITRVLWDEIRARKARGERLSSRFAYGLGTTRGKEIGAFGGRQEARRAHAVIQRLEDLKELFGLK